MNHNCFLKIHSSALIDTYAIPFGPAGPSAPVFPCRHIKNLLILFIHCEVNLENKCDLIFYNGFQMAYDHWHRCIVHILLWLNVAWSNQWEWEQTTWSYLWSMNARESNNPIRTWLSLEWDTIIWIVDKYIYLDVNSAFNSGRWILTWGLSGPLRPRSPGWP